MKWELIEKKSEFQLDLESLLEIKSFVVSNLENIATGDMTRDMFKFQEFHDFEQWVIEPDDLWRISANIAHILLDHPAQLDINIAHVSENKLAKLHAHENAIAVAIVLWEKHWYQNPKGSQIYDGKKWVTPKVWDEFVFQENIPHGLKRTSEWNLTFLTVQSLSVNPERFGLPVDYQEIK